jgi:hypothetical protein
MAKENDPQVGAGKEFPTDWHRDRYLEDLEREVLGAQRRVEELKVLTADPELLAQAEQQVANARAELKRLGHGQKAAAKRPRGSAKAETR